MSSMFDLPRGPFLGIGFCLVVNSFNIAMLFPFAYFMCRDFHLTTNDKELGYYAGALASAVMFGRFLSSFFWGKLSDKYGRKIVMKISIISTIVFSITFGFSTNYTMAITSRFLGGVFNSIIGTAKVMASEIASSSQQGAAMAFIGAVWGAGMIVGPGLGGLLSQLALTYPSLKGSFLDDFPYCLPCLVCAFLAIVAVLIEHYYIPETLKSLLNHEQVSQSDVQLELVSTEKAAEASFYSIDEAIDEATVSNPDDYLESSISSVSSSSASQIESEKDEHALLDSSNKNSGDHTLLPQNEDNHDMFSSNEQVTSVVDLKANFHLDSQKEVADPNSLWSDRKLVFLTIVTYAVWSMLDMMCGECFPLWAIADPSDGGLGFTASKIGLILSIVGGFVLFFQMIVYPILEKRFGPLILFRLASGIVSPINFFLPYITYTQHNSAALWFLLIFGRVIQSLLTLVAFTSCFILINNSTTKNKRGAVNGLAMSVASLFKAIGPALSGALFSWSLTNNYGFPLDFRFVNEIVGILSVVCCLMSYMLPVSINEPAPEES